jgi:hypothetical protein
MNPVDEQRTDDEGDYSAAGHIPPAFAAHRPPNRPQISNRHKVGFAAARFFDPARQTIASLALLARPNS